METPASDIHRRDVLHGAIATAAALAIGPHAPVFAASPKDDVIAKIAGRHDQTVKMFGLDRLPVDRRRESRLSPGLAADTGLGHDDFSAVIEPMRARARHETERT